MRAVEPQTFRKACGQFLTGVTIVTARGLDGQPVGLTANSFTSVSLDPPMVLVCIDKQIRSYPTFDQTAAYAVHILGEGQAELSARFASKEPDKFAGITWHEGPDGSPILPEALARFECKVAHNYPGGDHIILVGQVERVAIREDGEPPLGFLRGKYASVAQHK